MVISHTFEVGDCLISTRTGADGSSKKTKKKHFGDHTVWTGIIPSSFVSVVSVCSDGGGAPSKISYIDNTNSVESTVM